jgi:hypothetical protein
MPNQVQTYAFHDSDPAIQKQGFTRIKRSDAHDWNQKGYGIFQTVNWFIGPRRKSKLQGINAWAVDIDTGSKEQMLLKIHQGLIPTLVVETKRGYHLYWKAKDGSERTWKAIVWDRLVPFYGADRNAKDLCRTLRVPGFLHQKDLANPFLVKESL